MTARAQLAGVALAAALFALLPALPLYADGPAPAAASPAGNGREASLAEYRQHLVELNAVVDACTTARDTKTCDPNLAGQDDHVPLSNALNAERRLVRYNWLRELLEKAQLKDEATDKAPEHVQIKPEDKSQGKPEDKTPVKVENKGQSKADDKTQVETQGKPESDAAEAPAEGPTLPPKATTSEMLQSAKARLTQDIAQADELAAGETTAPPVADHAHERETMKQVLAGRDFRNLEAPTARDSYLEKLGAWLNQLWASAAKLQPHSAWVGRVIVGGFIVAVCVGLVWGLMQLERRLRIRLVPESDGPAADAASARDWQLWLADARKSAAAGLWREAIHFVYWAAISRLESKRLWPADRARTPREYLALVAAEDSRRAGLATLTSSFERTWYGGRAAAESDYLRAEALADGLISGGAAAKSGATEGGAR